MVPFEWTLMIYTFALLDDDGLYLCLKVQYLALRSRSERRERRTVANYAGGTPFAGEG